jgi:carbamoyltransferase
VDLLGPARKPGSELTERHQNIAASVQQAYEEVFFRMLQNLQLKTGAQSLALAGGCAMNSVANGKIRAHTQFRNIYVQPAAGDAGGAIGAALVTSAKLGVRPLRPSMSHAFLGPEFTQEQIGQELKRHQSRLESGNFETVTKDETTLVRHVAEKISDGAVVGWFQGRMEWGPRALGNRSILADPRRNDMQALLNKKIKRRESFRPFAPSVLKEFVSTWFETDDDVPFMEKVYPVRKSRHEQIPAVTHVDGSGRLQTVDRSSNPRYYSLIDEFYRITGVPILLNTSFNENEPIVCTPGQALECFLRTEMDMLVLGEICISRTVRE